MNILKIIQWSMIILFAIFIWIDFYIWIAFSFIMIFLIFEIKKISKRKNFIQKYTQKLNDEKFNLNNFTYFKKNEISNPRNIFKVEKDNFKFICFDIDLYYYVILDLNGPTRVNAMSLIFNLATFHRDKKKLVSTAFLIKIKQNFPNILISPKTFIEGFKKLTKDEIFLKKFPKFSKKYFLKTENQETALNALKTEIINFLLQNKIKYNLEFKDNYLLFFPRAKGMKISEKFTIHPMNFPKVMKSFLSLLEN